MATALDELIGQTMEVDPRLLPWLPELLADLPVIGAFPEDVVTALREAGLAPGARVLDLGCGRGTIAVAVAKQRGCRVTGVDGLAPFIEQARILAEQEGVAGQCDFIHGDLREQLDGGADQDAVLLLALGPIFGGHSETIAALRRRVKPGGLIVLDDAFLADGVPPAGDYIDYTDHQQTLARLTAHGDRVLSEQIIDADRLASMNTDYTHRIAARAAQIAERHPELAELLDGYVARQWRETELLGKDVVCALWVIQKGR